MKMWTKEETDQLFDLCERFDLRFMVIADRFPTTRSVEELKSRFYTVSRFLLFSRARSPGDVSGHSLVKESYNMAREIDRKRALSALFSQTKQQERRDAGVQILCSDFQILAEAKRIMELRMASKGAGDVELPTNAIGFENTEKSPALAESESPSASIQPLSIAAPQTATTESASTPASLRMLRVYLRSYALEQMVQTASSTAGLRTIKRIDQTLHDLGVHLKPRVPTKSKQLQNREMEASANRDSSYAEAASSPKHSYRGDVDRPFVPESVGFGGERVGKWDHKRKVSGRFDTRPSPPQSKRPWKLKASD